MYWVIKWCFEWRLVVFFNALPVLFIKYRYKGCIQRQMVVTHFSFHALPVCFIKYCHKLCNKDKWWFDESMSVVFCMEILEKELFYSLSTLILHWIKLENFVMQLKRQSVEVWQNENHYSKGNNTRDNPIPREESFVSVDHVKYEGQVRSQHLLFVQFSRWTFKLSCYSRKLL